MRFQRQSIVVYVDWKRQDCRIANIDDVLKCRMSIDLVETGTDSLEAKCDTVDCRVAPGCL
jgi:hypothetical protein